MSVCKICENSFVNCICARANVGGVIRKNDEDWKAIIDCIESLHQRLLILEAEHERLLKNKGIETKGIS